MFGFSEADRPSDSCLHSCHCFCANVVWRIDDVLFSFAQHGNRVGKEASQSCARLLVAAMLHYEPVVRKVALKSTIGCMGEDPSLAGAFILALQDFLAKAPSYPVIADP